MKPDVLASGRLLTNMTSQVTLKIGVCHELFGIGVCHELFGMF